MSTGQMSTVIPPFEIPKDWLRFRSMDWGSASPFSVGWWAIVQDDEAIDQAVRRRVAAEKAAA
jgi:hypothetical protein